MSRVDNLLIENKMQTIMPEENIQSFLQTGLKNNIRSKYSTDGRSYPSIGGYLKKKIITSSDDVQFKAKQHYYRQPSKTLNPQLENMIIQMYNLYIKNNGTMTFKEFKDRFLFILKIWLQEKSINEISPGTYLNEFIQDTSNVLLNMRTYKDDNTIYHREQDLSGIVWNNQDLFVKKESTQRIKALDYMYEVNRRYKNNVKNNRAISRYLDFDDAFKNLNVHQHDSKENVNIYKRKKYINTYRPSKETYITFFQ